jgi:hypothetical protein
MVGCRAGLAAFDIGASDRCITIFKSYLASQIPQRMRTETRLPFEGTGPKATVKPSQDRYAEKRRIFPTRRDQRVLQ